MKNTSTRHRADERGAIAIMVGLSMIMLLTLGALTVDIGNALVHKHDMQKKADLSALAGSIGDDLPAAMASTTCPYAGSADQAVKDVATYLSEHWNTTVTSSELTDCNFANGEVGYGQFSYGPTGWRLAPNKNQISVVSQADTVNFGMARVLGFRNVKVNGVATVEIKTQLARTLPFYAKSACSWGEQTISQPPNGQAGTLPLLFAPSDTNAARLTTLVTNPATTPPQIAVNPATTADSLVINAESGTLAGVTKVGFFQSGDLTNGPDPEGTPNTTTTTFTIDSGNSTITIPHIPTAVSSVEGAWYIRVKIGTGQWSPVTTGNGNNTVFRALRLLIGAPTLTCGQGSDSGNFGTLDLPPASPPASGLNGVNDQIAYNISQGLTSRLSAFNQPDWTINRTCTASTPKAILWRGVGTNCVLTQPGVPSNAAEQGFLTGVGSYAGLLHDTASSKFCPNSVPNGTSHLGTLRNVQVNDDILSCYFTADSATIAAASAWCGSGGITVACVSSQNYAGPAVIDQHIYESPRFVNVPILSFPGNGSSTHWQILGFRPGFITDQPATATRSNGVLSESVGCSSNSNNFTGSCNGIAYDHGTLQAVNVIFLNQKALTNPPQDPNGQYIPYVGSGPKVPLLVN